MEPVSKETNKDGNPAEQTAKKQNSDDLKGEIQMVLHGNC